MGCCASILSHNDDEQHPYPHSTHRHPSLSHSDTRRRRVPDLPLNQHYNEPIRNHVWTSKRRTWTRVQIDRERTEFFDTRVTGRAEIWAAVSTAISLMRSGDLATAQGIIDAAGITVPTGDLCEGCYDQQGVLYRLPQCIVSDPENMVVSSRSERDRHQDGDGDGDGDGGGCAEEELDHEALSDGKLATDDASGDASGDELISQDIERRRDEKGKTSERDLIRVLARLSEGGGPDILLSMAKSQTVGFLARRVHQEANLDADKRVRIAYLGHFLNERVPLIEQGWQAGHVVNALVVAPVDDLAFGRRS